MIGPILERNIAGKTQQVYKFDNGYGASVIRGPYTYGGPEGLWELGVIRFNNPDDPLGFTLDYSTWITKDVIGYLSYNEVQKHLAHIQALEKE